MSDKRRVSWRLSEQSIARLDDAAAKLGLYPGQITDDLVKIYLGGYLKAARPMVRRRARAKRGAA